MVLSFYSSYEKVHFEIVLWLDKVTLHPGLPSSLVGGSRVCGVYKMRFDWGSTILPRGLTSA
jgi:hypothetical protein